MRGSGQGREGLEFEEGSRGRVVFDLHEATHGV